MRFEALLEQIGLVHTQAQQAAGGVLHQIFSFRNWLVGAWIVEYEQGGEDRAAYGDRLISRLASELVEKGYRGLSASNLKNFRQVALAYPGLDVLAVAHHLALDVERAGSGAQITPAVGIRQTSGEFRRPRQIRQTSGESAMPGTGEHLSKTSAQLLFPSLRACARDEEELEWRDRAWLSRLFAMLSFSHLLELSRIESGIERAFYELQCLKEGWAVRELKRQRETLLFERAGLSRDKEGLLALVRDGKLTETPWAVLRDPYVLEFLELSSRQRFTESDLEQALLDHLQTFLLELGADFCFMARQYRISIGTDHHFIDLLFYHRGLRCLVAFDLKVEKFRHEHAGQMNFYVNFLAENVARPDENPPIGVILCTDKHAAEVHYSTVGIDHSVFVSRYLLHLPSEDQLAGWLREERANLEAESGAEDG